MSILRRFARNCSSTVRVVALRCQNCSFGDIGLWETQARLLIVSIDCHQLGNPAPQRVDSYPIFIIDELFSTSLVAHHN